MVYCLLLQFATIMVVYTRVVLHSILLMAVTYGKRFRLSTQSIPSAFMFICLFVSTCYLKLLHGTYIPACDSPTQVGREEKYKLTSWGSVKLVVARFDGSKPSRHARAIGCRLHVITCSFLSVLSHERN